MHFPLDSRLILINAFVDFKFEYIILYTYIIIYIMTFIIHNTIHNNNNMTIQYILCFNHIFLTEGDKDNNLILLI